MIMVIPGTERKNTIDKIHKQTHACFDNIQFLLNYITNIYAAANVDVYSIALTNVW